MHGLYKSSGNPETQPSACQHLIGFLHPIELVEYAFQIVGGNALTFVKNLETNGLDVPPAPDANRRADGRILCRVIEDIKEDLLKKDRIQLDHREVWRKLKLDMMLSENLVCAPQRTADDFSQVVWSGVRHYGPKLKLGHVEQVGDEPIEPLGTRRQ